MAEDFRAVLVVEGEHEGHRLAGRLGRWDAEDELEGQLPDRVVVSHDGPELFLYANTREELDRAIEAAQRVLASSRVERVERWHDAEESWEDADRPLPQTEDEIEEEQRRLAERERAEAERRGEVDWEVRAELPSRRLAEELEEWLDAQGHPAVRRWKYVFVPVPSEEDGRELAELILHSDAGEAASVDVEGTGAATARGRPFGGNVFAIFGGLGN
ncbi:MAG TPA: hypothetical protein VF752_13895 [Thermoleophilaceae bacterium]